MGTRAPKLTQLDSKLKSVERESGFDVPVLCQAQGFPVPSFRYFSIALRKVSVSTFFIEPIGFKAPTFSNDLKMLGYERAEGHSFGLLCPAQGLPLPSFRYTIFLVDDRVFILLDLVILI